MRLLLVEDEKKVSELVARALRQESYAVDIADDGPSGWELAQAYEYDLIILDLMLPGLPGEELLKRMRRRNQPGTFGRRLGGQRDPAGFLGDR